MLVVLVSTRLLMGIEADLEGDTYFPQLDTTAFKEVSRDRVPKNEKNAYDFSISRYEKERD